MAPLVGNRIEVVGVTSSVADTSVTFGHRTTDRLGSKSPGKASRSCSAIDGSRSRAPLAR
jgi:hypothetical protein